MIQEKNSRQLPANAVHVKRISPDKIPEKQVLQDKDHPSMECLDSIARARVCSSAYLMSIPMGIPQASRVIRTGYFRIRSMRNDAVASPGTVELVAMRTSSTLFSSI